MSLSLCEVLHLKCLTHPARNNDGRPVVAMFRLDYLSCFLTVVATILVGRRMWSGLVVSCVNSLIVCVIGLHTSQYGFVPANVFCICINAFNLRTWLKVQKHCSESRTELLPCTCAAISSANGSGVVRLPERAIGMIKGLIPGPGQRNEALSGR
jgi:hypothetical protein